MSESLNTTGSQLSQSPATSFVKAANRAAAVDQMIRPDPWLSQLYRAGKADDGKDGWVNAIRDASGGFYRLLFYLNKLPLSQEFQSEEMYEVIYGTIQADGEPNYPRALFTTTGAINLMRDGIPGPRFVQSVLKGLLEIAPYERVKDTKTSLLRDQGYSFVCVYDRDGQGIRVLDLLQYSMIYHLPDRHEIQIHRDDSLVVGETKFVRPFLLRHVAQSTSQPAPNAASAAWVAQSIITGSRRPSAEAEDS